MSAHSHVTRIQMLERNKPGYQVPSSQGTPSIISSDMSGSKAPTASLLSGDSRKANVKDLKKSRSQEFLDTNAESLLSVESSRLKHNYAPSMHSLRAGSAMGQRIASRTSLASGMGQRIASKTSLASMSRSLGASKASLASQKSTIQQEYHDIKVQRRLRAPWFGVARKPFRLAIMFFSFASVFLIIGLTVLFLYCFGNIFLSHDKAMITGPLFVALFILSTAVGIKFIVDAYRIGNKERRKIKFRGDDVNMVNVTKPGARKQPTEKLITGTNTNMAISRQLATNSRSEIQMA